MIDVFFTTRSQGLGVGLSICHSIIEAHGGRMWATDNLEGGTVFHFSVSAVVDTAAGSADDGQKRIVAEMLAETEAAAKVSP